MSSTAIPHRSWWSRFLQAIYLPAIFRGMAITLRHLLARKVTEQYPEERWQLPQGYRGFPELVQDDNGVERCVACGLCEIACPAYAIYIKPGEYPDPNVKDRFPVEFNIDMGRCIVCGYCEEACPVDAIRMSNRYELVSGNLADLIFKKDLLLDDFDNLEVPHIWEERQRDASERRANTLRPMFVPSDK